MNPLSIAVVLAALAAFAGIGAFILNVIIRKVELEAVAPHYGRSFIAVALGSLGCVGVQVGLGFAQISVPVLGSIAIMLVASTIAVSLAYRMSAVAAFGVVVLYQVALSLPIVACLAALQNEVLGGVIAFGALLGGVGWLANKQRDLRLSARLRADVFSPRPPAER